MHQLALTDAFGVFLKSTITNIYCRWIFTIYNENIVTCHNKELFTDKKVIII